MIVTIKGTNELLGLSEKAEGIDWDLVSIKETHKRNGQTIVDVRIKRGKRDIVFSNAVYDTITIQDDETGRLVKKIKR